MFSPPPEPSNQQSPDFKEPDDYADIPEPRRQQALNRARKWFFILVSTGLAMGIIVAIAVVQLLNNSGLTNKPGVPFDVQIERGANEQK